MKRFFRRVLILDLLMVVCVVWFTYLVVGPAPPASASYILKPGAVSVYGDGSSPGFRVGSPIPVDPVSAGMAFTTFAINQATDQQEYVWQCSEAVAITHLGFRYTTRTGTPVQHKISLQGVDLTTGNPDGVIKGGGTPASGLFTPPADATWNATWQWIMLDNSYTCARGELLSTVVAPVGVPDGANNSSFSGWISTSVNANSIPYSIQNDGGARTKQVQTSLYGYKSSGRVFGRPIATGAYQTFSVDSATDEYALRFSIGAAGTSPGYQVLGFRMWSGQNAGKTVLCSVYSGTTALQTITWDTDVTGGGTQQNRGVELYFDEVSLSTLEFGSVYRLACAPQDTLMGNFGIQIVTLPDAASQAAFPGGSAMYLSSRVDSGAWTDDTTKRPMLDLIIRTP